MRASVEADLGLRLGDEEPALGTLFVRRRGDADVVILFRGRDGHEVERQIALPADRALATETLALAVGNLVRDEASEILASLAPPSPPPALPSPPAPLLGDSGPRLPSCSDGPQVFFGGDVVPFVGTSSLSLYRDKVRQLSLNLVLGYSRGLSGVEVGVGGNIDTSFMCGVQVAAGGNVVLGPVRGLQLASGNIALGPVQGAQIGAIDIAEGDVRGGQVGSVEIAGDSLVGGQAGSFNFVAGKLTGAQFGAVNLAFGGVDGVQIGAVNVSGERVRGTQLGVFNYADSADAPVGVVSIVRHGRTSLEAWGTESGLVMGGVRHGGGVVHNLYGGGYYAGPTPSWALALGIGVRVPLAAKLHLDIDLIENWLPRKPTRLLTQLSQASLSVGYAVSEALGVMAGPTFNVLVTDDDQRQIEAPWGSTSLSQGGTTRVNAWPGVTAGVRANL